MVDPQLRNNPELVLALQEYEASWERGKRYLVEQQKESQVVALSTIIDAAADKHPMFAGLLDDADPSIFWLIPSGSGRSAILVGRSVQSVGTADTERGGGGQRGGGVTAAHQGDGGESGAHESGGLE